MKHISSPTAPFDPAIGVGLRPPHMDEVSRGRPAVDFFEVHPENYVLDHRGRAQLESIRTDYPLSLHAVGLSLGSAEGIDDAHLNALHRLVEQLDPFLVSDHLSWSTVDGIFLNDLLPLPYTDESLGVLARNIDHVQSTLGRQILIENPSAYVAFSDNAYDEPAFLRLLVEKTGCGLLLDVNNVFVSAVNLGFDAHAYLSTFAFEAVREIHLAGHARKEVGHQTVLIDDHGARVADPVWPLYELAMRRAPSAVTLVEWDSNIPPLDVLLDERDKAADVARNARRPRPVTAFGATQTRLARALLGAEDRVPGLVGHVSIHRNNVRESLTAALRTVYQAVEALVGAPFFRQTAWQFIQVNPPTTPALAGYGAAFADFLEGLPSCQGLPYLGDVARLEWYASRVPLGVRQAALSPEALRNEISGDPAHLVLAMQAGLAYLASPYPVDEIWVFARNDGEGPSPAMEGDAVHLEIGPGPDGLLIRRLAEPDFRFRAALHQGADLGTASSRAIEADPLFDLPLAIRSALRDGIFTDCRLRPSHSEEMELCQR